MDKVINITEILPKTAIEETKPILKAEKVTNPILKKLAQFKNSKLSKKFDINDLK